MSLIEERVAVLESQLTRARSDLNEIANENRDAHKKHYDREDALEAEVASLKVSIAKYEWLLGGVTACVIVVAWILNSTGFFNIASWGIKK
jgi:cytochrome c-type biogenesis protein CcmH/NrfG